jgi:hypothetical protein
MKWARLGWAVWAVVPVAGLAYHFGPGQRLYAQERAVKLHSDVVLLEQQAEAAQQAAYAMHLAALDARREATAHPTPATEAKSRLAAEAEQEAFNRSSKAWVQVADAWGRIQEMAAGVSDETLWRVRWSRSRALVRAGDIWTGIAELESVLTQLEQAGKLDGQAGLATREELASAYYYGARLMRLSGDAPEQWLIESGKARQHFRYLAEKTRGDARTAALAANYQRDVELVLDLEQNSLLDIQGKPLPKDSPLGRKGNRPGQGEGKSKRPPQEKDGRGAGGAEAITSGW